MRKGGDALVARLRTPTAPGSERLRLRKTRSNERADHDARARVDRVVAARRSSSSRASKARELTIDVVRGRRDREQRPAASTSSTLALSGAGSADLGGVTATERRHRRISGARQRHAAAWPAARLTGDMSGAGNLEYFGHVSEQSVDTSGFVSVRASRLSRPSSTASTSSSLLDQLRLDRRDAAPHARGSSLASPRPRRGERGRRRGHAFLLAPAADGCNRASPRQRRARPASAASGGGAARCFDPRRVGLRRRTAAGHRVGEDHGQGRRRADRGRPARRGRRGHRAPRRRQRARAGRAGRGAGRAAARESRRRRASRSRTPARRSRAAASSSRPRSSARKRSTTAKAAYDAAQASLDVADARARRSPRRASRVAQRKLDDTVVRAPFAGIVTVKAAQEGEMVSPISAGGGFTRTGIGTIVDMDSLEVEVDVSENFISRVQTGQPVAITLNAYPDRRLPGRVIAIIPTADRAKATVKVRVGFDGSATPRVLPEMGARVRIPARRRPAHRTLERSSSDGYGQHRVDQGRDEERTCAASSASRCCAASISRWSRASSSRSWAVGLRQDDAAESDRRARPARSRRDHRGRRAARRACRRASSRNGARRHVGFIFQFYNLLPVLTAERNVEVPLLLTKLSAKERQRNVAAALELVGLADRAKHKPGRAFGRPAAARRDRASARQRPVGARLRRADRRPRSRDVRFDPRAAAAAEPHARQDHRHGHARSARGRARVAPALRRQGRARPAPIGNAA